MDILDEIHKLLINEQSFESNGKFFRITNHGITHDGITETHFITISQSRH